MCLLDRAIAGLAHHTPNFGHHCLNACSMFRFIDQVFCLVRIVPQIVQFIEIEAVEDEFPVTLPDDALR